MVVRVRNRLIVSRAMRRLSRCSERYVGYVATMATGDDFRIGDGR